MKHRDDGLPFGKKLVLLLVLGLILSHPVRAAFCRKTAAGYTMGWRHTRSVPAWLSLVVLLFWAALAQSPFTLYVLLPGAVLFQLELVLNTPRTGQHSRSWGQSQFDVLTGDTCKSRNVESALCLLAGLVTYGFDTGGGSFLIAAAVGGIAVSAYMKTLNEHTDADVEDARQEAVHYGRSRRRE